MTKSILNSAILKIRFNSYPSLFLQHEKATFRMYEDVSLPSFYDPLQFITQGLIPLEGNLTRTITADGNKAILELYLSSVSSSDEGMYKCEAWNEYESSSSDVQVNVMSDEPYEYTHEYENHSSRNFACFPEVNNSIFIQLQRTYLNTSFRRDHFI